MQSGHDDLLWFDYEAPFRPTSLPRLKPLKCDDDFDAFVQCSVNNDHVLHVYSSSSEFDLNESTIEQNVRVKNDSGSELDDDDYNIYDYCSSVESDTASIDHLFDGEEEVLE
nr:transposase, Ptta/En/Spm [Tanacetum cinerariifolium]